MNTPIHGSTGCAAPVCPRKDLRTSLDVEVQSFQQRVHPWLMECFGPIIAGDREERNHRFLEEALELVQACGATADEAHQLVDYVYGRSVGEKAQEVGGVMVTLAALCLAQDLDMNQSAETELARIWTKVEQIRAKQAAKPKHSPLPEAPAQQQLPAVRAEPVAWIRRHPSGELTTEIIPDPFIEDVRRKSGAWHPLVLAQPPSVDAQNTDLLNYLISSKAIMAQDDDGFYLWWHTSNRCGPIMPTPRQAIDAAMQKGGAA